MINKFVRIFLIIVFSIGIFSGYFLLSNKTVLAQQVVANLSASSDSCSSISLSWSGTNVPDYPNGGCTMYGYGLTNYPGGNVGVYQGGGGQTIGDVPAGNYEYTLTCYDEANNRANSNVNTKSVTVNACPPPTGTIQGFCVDENMTPIGGCQVTSNGIVASGAPYYLNGVPSGSQPVATYAISGYQFRGYTLDPNHGTASIIPGNWPTVTVPGGGAVNVYWHFGRTIVGQCAATHFNCAPNGGTTGATATHSSEYHWYCDGRYGGANSPLCVEYRPVCSATKYACTQGTSGSNSASNSNYTWNCSAAGETIACSTPIPPPTGGSGSCNAAGTTGTFSWTAPSGHNTFYTRGSTGGYGDSSSSVSGAWNDNFVGTINNFTTIPGTTYYWWVHTKDTATGQWSSAIQNQFTCPDVPVPVCGATPYSCSPGTSGNNLAGHLNYSWTCSNSIGQTASCSAPIPPPSSPTSWCSADGTVGNVSWNLPAGQTQSYFRIRDDTAGGAWLNSLFIPDVRPDNGPSTSFATTPGHTYTAWMHTRVPGSYNNGMGGYSTEVYTSFTCNTPPSCTSATPDGATVTSATHDVSINGVAGATAVKAYVWSDVNGQDDLWPTNGIYSAVDQGGGIWKATINLANHRAGNPDYGTFSVHAYMEKPGFPGPYGIGTMCDTANFTRTGVPVCGVTPYACAPGTSGNNLAGHLNYSWDCTDNGATVSCLLPIPPPTAPIIGCAINGTSASASWNLPSGYSNSYFRLQNLTTSTNLSFIPDNVADTGPSTTFAVTPGHNYQAWVHTRVPGPYNGGLGGYSTEVYSGWFNCPDTPMTGTLTPAPVSCEIALGASSCNVNLTWTTTNPQGVSAVTATGIDPVNGNNDSGSFVVPYGGRTFYLYNNAIQLATSEATANCVSGTIWNGTTCQVPIVLSGSLSGSNCLIARNESSCNTNLSWSIAYPESAPTAITANGMEDLNVSFNNITTPQSGQDPVNIPFPGRTFYLYNNAKSLHPTAGFPNGSGLSLTARCENGIYWDGVKCAQDVPRNPIPDLRLENADHDSAQSALGVLPGQNIKFTWNTYQTNSSTACWLEGGVSGDNWSGVVVHDHPLDFPYTAPTVPGTYQYTLKCTQDRDLGMEESNNFLSFLIRKVAATDLVTVSDSAFLRVNQMIIDPCEGASACSCEGSTCNCYSGQCLTISWECTVPPSTASEGIGFSTDIDGNGIGDTSGSVTFVPVASGEYSMQCNNGGGNGSPIMVNVKKKPIFKED